MRLKDKVAIVTGGAHGMGEAEARLFAKEGAAVVIADVLQKEGEAVAADIRAGQGRATFVTTDVTSETAWKQLIATTLETYGRLDILVNNAGISGSSVGDELALAGWERLMAVNATSVFLGTTLAAAEMANTGGGSIVNISSIMGVIGGPDSHPGYSASKGAVRIFTKSAAVRFGPSGVRVNSVHPGYLPPMLNNTNRRRTHLQGGRDAAASPRRGHGCRLWRSLPGIRRSVVRYRNRARDRRRLYRAVGGRSPAFSFGNFEGGTVSAVIVRFEQRRCLQLSLATQRQSRAWPDNGLRGRGLRDRALPDPDRAAQLPIPSQAELRALVPRTGRTPRVRAATSD